MEIAEFIKSITREKNLSRIGEPSDESLVKAFDIIDNATEKILVINDETIKSPGLIYDEAKENEGTFVYHEFDNSLMFYDDELEEYLQTCEACINVYGNFTYELRAEVLITWVCRKFNLKVKPTACYFPKTVEIRQM